MAMFLSNLRSAWRQLTRSPVVSLVAVVSLALGIGANTTVFTLVNALLLNPMPVHDLSRVVVIGTTEMRDGAQQFLGGTSRLNFVDLRDQQSVFSGAVVTGFTPLSLSGNGEPEQLFAQIVSGNYFDVLGPPLAAGRTFIPDEDRELGAHPVVVLSHSLWTRRFGADPAIVGKTLTLNGHNFTVIGVAGEGFRGTFPIGGPDVWVPFAMYREVLTGLGAEGYNSRRGLIYQAFARLKDGVSLEQAQANVDGIGRGLAESFPTDNRGRSFALRPLSEGVFPPAFKQQLVLSGSLGMAVVALVLLIACGNVANLQLARASTRRQEIAVRLSIGASRSRLIQQFLAESLLLAAAGGVGGLLVAYWSRAILWAYRPPFLQPGAVDLNFDLRVLGFAMAVSLITGLLFGLAPALQASRPDLVTELKERTTLSSGTRWYNVRHLLVVGQVALSLITLVTAGLFLRSLGNAQQTDLGFDGDRVIVLSMNAGTQGFNEARGRDLYRRALERLAGAPGVESVTLSSALPLFNGGFSRTTFRDDQDIKDPRNGRLTQINEVARPLFRDARHPDRARPRLHAQRSARFDAGHHHQRGHGQAVLSQRRSDWPPPAHLQPPAGARDRGHRENHQYNFVGEEPTTHMYVPIEQSYSSQVTVQVRAAGEPDAVLGTVRRELQQIEPTMPLLNVNTYRSILATSLWAPRMGASLLTIFGVLALLLASVGLYGVMAYSVNQRTREIGIRMALGAEALQVRGMIVRQGLSLAAGGVILGVAGAFGLSRLVTRLLFGITGADPFTFALVPVVLLAVAGIATAFPAWKASRVDPITALRV